ncbi:ankyrin [Panus rudis PR-1116 ss-1]|nr:ankyrin [Panus rudis PR-1116 ss-1]
MSESPANGTHKPGELPQETVDFAHRMFDAARGGDKALLEAALEVGLPANLTNAQGNTLLMLAAYSGHAEVVRDLIAKGADVNRLNDKGQAPVAGAVFKGYEEVVRVLIEGGADPRLGTPTAIQTARMLNQQNLLKILGATEADMQEAVPLPPDPPTT